jgi:hypothetical protein
MIAWPGPGSPQFVAYPIHDRLTQVGLKRALAARLECPDLPKRIQ